MMVVFIRRGNMDTGTERRHREKMAIYKPRRKASEEISPADTLISDF